MVCSSRRWVNLLGCGFVFDSGFAFAFSPCEFPCCRGLAVARVDGAEEEGFVVVEEAKKRHCFVAVEGEEEILLAVEEEAGMGLGLGWQELGCATDYGFRDLLAVGAEEEEFAAAAAAIAGGAWKLVVEVARPLPWEVEALEEEEAPTREHENSVV